MMKPLTIGHSPDPDDAFMFYAMTHGRIDTRGYSFREHLEGIDALNRRAELGEFELSAVSLHQFPYVADRYALMAVGASMGEGYGPILVAAHKTPVTPETRIAIPGERTSATLLLKLSYGGSLNLTEHPFDKIEEAVLEGRFDAGLLIHEGQLTYEEKGLTLLRDLGAWWKQETDLPTPLGVNVVRRDVAEPEVMDDILRESIAWGFLHEEETAGYAMKYGRGLEKERVTKFVRMYVNDFTMDLGDRGRAAVKELLNRGAAAGLVPPLPRSALGF